MFSIRDTVNFGTINVTTTASKRMPQGRTIAGERVKNPGPSLEIKYKTMFSFHYKTIIISIRLY